MCNGSVLSSYYHFANMDGVLVFGQWSMYLYIAIATGST